MCAIGAAFGVLAWACGVGAWVRVYGAWFGVYECFCVCLRVCVKWALWRWVNWSYGVMVSTLDFESSDPGSSPGRTCVLLCLWVFCVCVGGVLVSCVVFVLWRCACVCFVRVCCGFWGR